MHMTSVVEDFDVIEHGVVDFDEGSRALAVQELVLPR